MRILHKQIFKEVLAHGLLGLLLFTFVLFLRDSNHLLELLLRQSAYASDILTLFLLAFPAILNFTIPVAILLGILITLSRMASEGEVIALRASGVGIRAMLAPLVAFALLGCALATSLSVWGTPETNRRRLAIERDIGLRQISTVIHPRIFEEGFPNLVLYVQDIVTGQTPLWHGVFLADMAAPQGPKITVAERGVLIGDASTGHLQLHLSNGVVHESDPVKGEYSVGRFSETDIPVHIPAPRPAAIKPIALQTTGELGAVPRTDSGWMDARIEYHRRIAIPVACIVLAIAAIPLGLSSHKGGKSTGVILAVLIVVIYYSLFIGGISVARQGLVPPWAGVWAANFAFLLWGLWMLRSVDGVAPLFSWLNYLSELWETAKHSFSTRLVRRSAIESSSGPVSMRLSTLPMILDRYIVRMFLFYLFVTLASLVLITEVVTFFVDLLNDVIRNQAPLSMVFNYFVHLTPQLIYLTSPLAVLLAILIAFSLLTQRNEITAIKASGISLFRLSLPIFFLAALFSMGLFAFDFLYIPAANQIQDAVRNQIKGRPAQTFYRPDRQWMFGQNSRIYYYSYFDAGEQELGGVTVFELDPKTFQLRRRISAGRAHWEPSLNGWVFADGWVRDLEAGNVKKFEKFDVRLFSELREPPSYFLKEVKQSSQMNPVQLRGYLNDLKQSGFDVVPLSVQLHKKYAFPLFTLIMAFIGMPFAFSAGRKGALAGIAISIGIAIVYWGTSSLFEALGNLNELPAFAAAWSPNLIFGLGGLYLFLRIET